MITSNISYSPRKGWLGLWLMIVGLSPLFGQSYAGYYELIREAKTAIISENYLQAQENYRTAFDNYEFEFARDCIHAAELSAFLQDSAATFDFCRLALRRGVPLSYLEGNPRIIPILRGVLLGDLRSEAEDLHQAYLASVNTEIRLEINEMFAQDQRIRRKYYRWHNFLFRPFIMSSWRKLNRKQAERIMEISEELGFPGEQLIGIDTPQDHEKIDFDQLSAGMPIVVLLHHYSHPEPFFDSLLLEQVDKGYLHNRHYATLCDYASQLGKGKFYDGGAFGTALAVDTESQVVATNRERLFLNTVEEMRLLQQIGVLTRFWRKLY
ncbi:MAG: hypothetical protein AAFP08_12785 [Bacteroidota bacterium]